MIEVEAMGVARAEPKSKPFTSTGNLGQTARPQPNMSMNYLQLRIEPYVKQVQRGEYFFFNIFV